MSQENVEIVLWAIVAFNRRDMRGLAELSHEDLEFVSVLTAVDAGGATYRGSETWTTYFAAMNETWEEWQAEDFQLFDGGARIASHACSAWSARASTAAPRSSARSAWRTGSEMGSCGGCGPTSTLAKPSKPPGCGSRRCRSNAAEALALPGKRRELGA